MCAFLCVLAGCGNDDGGDNAPKTIEPANCETVRVFGNGRTCSSKEPALGVCGGAGARTCAGGWLCFDSPEVAFCSCETDDDCLSRAAYINTARAVRKVAPLGAKCVAGRCAGAP